ncbi:F420-dependent oxidoreductase [Candidatus Bathyarchaeota archaeon]|nr:MAG: F420-dependent oxidoreductase [Candidatus Bathyarchaeota archaeon]
MKVEMFGLSLPEVKPGDDLARILVDSCVKEAGGIRDGDILVVTSKIVSKAHGLLIKVGEVKPGVKALKIAKKTGMDPKMVQAVLDNSDEILFAVPFMKLVEKGLINIECVAQDKERAYQAVRKIPCLLIVRRGGQIYSDAGLDFSNHPEGIASIPPEDPDEYAKELREEIRGITGKEVAVIISDTEVAPFVGSLDLARGASGIEVVSRKFGELDRYGKPKFGGVDHVANELACASALLMGQTSEGIPAVLIRGLKYVKSEEGISSYSLSSKTVRAIIKEIIKQTIRITGIKSILRLMFSLTI